MSIEKINGHRTSDGIIHKSKSDAVAHEMSLEVSIGFHACRRVVEKAALVRELLDFLRPEEPIHTYEAMLGAGDAGLASDWRTWTPDDARTLGPVHSGHVEVRLRSGSVRVGAVDSFRWDARRFGADIVAWRPA